MPRGDLKETAPHYDRLTKESAYISPEVAFGLMYEFVNPGQKLLDLGIGTGLASALFHKAGLKIYGVDSSPYILDVCRAKGFAAHLEQADLNKVLSFPDADFDHVISVGVLTFLESLDHVFKETARVIRKNGCFAFEIVLQKQDTGDPEPYSWPGRTYLKLYKHSAAYTENLLNKYDFNLLKCFEFHMLKPAGDHTLVKIHVAQKG